MACRPAGSALAADFGARHLPGSAENFFSQWSLQKKYVLPSKAKRRGESAATFIPHTGSM